METLSGLRYAVGINTAVALLTGCVGSLTSMPAAHAPLQNTEGASRAARLGSWISKGAARSDLLYVSSRDGNVYVFTYPGGAPVGTLSGFDIPEGLCSDRNGNVWVTNEGDVSGMGYLLEYAHGGTSPIATLSDPYESPVACAIDPTTGNLAVANCPFGSCGSTVAIYSNAQGVPSQYSTSPLWGPTQITYDAAGDIFIAAEISFYDHQIGWLPAGSSSFQIFKMQPHTHASHNVQWDGKYLAVAKTKEPIRRYRIVDGYGQAAGGADLDGCCGGEEMWIQGSTLISASGASAVSLWKYPEGGAPKKTISLPTSQALGVTVSVAPRL
jgi:WD40 repeat protein